MSNACARLAESIVDDLERTFSDLIKVGCNWDHDTARRVIQAGIPETRAELEDEIRQMDDSPPVPRGPSKIQILRNALHADGLSLHCVLDAAIAKVQRCNQLENQLLEKERTCDI